MTLRLCQQNKPWQSCDWLWGPTSTSLVEQLLPWGWGVSSNKDSLCPLISGVAFKLHPSGALLSGPSCAHPHSTGWACLQFPELLWDPLEPEELQHWGHMGTVWVPQDQNSHPQTLLRQFSNVPLKAASIATLFLCCRQKQQHLFCPHWAGNIAYLFQATLPICHDSYKAHSHFPTSSQLILSRKHCSSLDILI